MLPLMMFPLASLYISPITGNAPPGETVAASRTESLDKLWMT
jgi:hypothetical protein